MRRPRHPLVVAALLVVTALGLSACAPGCGYGPWRTGGSVVASGIPDVATPGQVLKIDLTGTRLSNVDRPCITAVLAEWVPEGAKWADDGSTAGPGGPSWAWQPKAVWQNPTCESIDGVVLELRVPDDYVTAQLSLLARGREADPAFGWSYDFVQRTWLITRAGSSGDAEGSRPVPRLFAHEAPADRHLPALVDARLSTDPQGQALSFSWDLNNDGVFGDLTDGGTGVTPESGLAYVPTSAMQTTWGGGSQYQPVSVRVTATDGRSATAIERIRITENLGNGFITTPAPHSFAPGDPIVIELRAPPNSGAAPGNELTACLDTNGDDVYGDGGPISINDAATSSTRTITAAPTAGYHRIGAVFWRTGYNADCANTGGDTFDNRENNPYIQVVYALYQTTSPGPRKGTKPYRAKATLRTSAGTPIAVGTFARDGSVTGVIARGTYAFRAPPKAKGVARPAVLGQFRGGPYVVRLQRARLGTVAEKGSVPLIGDATMLVRGARGALACFSVRAVGNSTTYTLTGGTGTAARASMVATSGSTRYPITGGSPVPKGGLKGAKQKKPTRGNGTVVASATKRARALPAACKALVRHLP